MVECVTTALCRFDGDRKAFLDIVLTCKFVWPDHTLLVDVKRGSEQLIPDANTVIRAGDFLYVLAETENAEEVQALGSDLRN